MTASRSLLLVASAHEAAQHIQGLLASAARPAFDVVRAPQLHDAVAALAQRRPAAILLDLPVPHSNGLGALRQIVAHNDCAPIIVLTPHDNTSRTQNCLPKAELSASELARAGAPVERHAPAVRSARHCPGGRLLSDLLARICSRARRKC